MKKIFGLIAVFILLSGCDDGDMTFKTFDFGTATPQSCASADTDNNVIFKINGTEAIILKLSPTALANVSTFDPETGTQKPRIIEVTFSGPNTITYRNYNGTVANTTFCSEIPPSSPSVIEEWKGQGQLSIRTDEVRLGERLTGFTHQITLKNISFDQNGETVTINENLFGSVEKKLGFLFDFVAEGAEKPVVAKCPENKLLYTRLLKEALILSLAEPLNNVDKTITLGNANNRVIFKVYDNTLTEANICDDLPPLTPNILQQWEAIAGEIRIDAEEGIGGIFIHKITLHNIVFNNTRKTTETFELEDVIPVDPDTGYIFGDY